MIPPMLLEIAEAVAPPLFTWHVSESDGSYVMQWVAGRRSDPDDGRLTVIDKMAGMRVDPRLFDDLVNFGERMVRAELEHEARKVVAKLTEAP